MKINGLSQRVLSLLMILVCVLALASCQTAQRSEPVDASGPFPGTPDADTVVLSILSDPAALNHMLLQDAPSADVLRLCMSGIARLDRNDVAVPDLAERWEISEDGRVYTIYLRQDALWSNGDPVTAHDYYFSWVMQMTPSTGSIYAAFLYENIKNGAKFYAGEVDESQLGIKVLDDYTLQVEWSSALYSADYRLAFPSFLPINQRVYEEIGAEDYAKDADKMVTNGPYRLTEWVHDDQILLERSDDYYNAQSIHIPKVKLAIISDGNTRLNAFQAGEIDLCNLTGNQIELLRAQDADVIETYIDGNTFYLCFNQRSGPLANANLRRALTYGLDIQSLLDNVVKDGSVPADGLVPTVIAGAEGAYAQARGSLYGYDLEAARSYFELALSELDMSASDLTLELMSSDSTYSQTQASYVKQQWADALGIDVSIRVLPWKALLESEVAGDFNIICEGWAPGENDAMTFLEVYRSSNGYNYGGYNNPEYDRLTAAAYAEDNIKVREELMIEAEKLLIADMGIGPMYFTCTAYATSDKLEGLVRTPFQTFNITDGARIVTPDGQ